MLFSGEVGDKLTIDAVKGSAEEIFGTSLAAFVLCKFTREWFWLSSARSSLILLQFGFPHSKKSSCFKALPMFLADPGLRRLLACFYQ